MTLDVKSQASRWWGMDRKMSGMDERRKQCTGRRVRSTFFLLGINEIAYDLRITEKGQHHSTSPQLFP